MCFSGSGFRVSASGFMAPGLGFKVWRVGFSRLLQRRAGRRLIQGPSYVENGSEVYYIVPKS